MRNGDWIQTYTGRQFWPLDPRPEEIDILDIAHALSNQCRFGGHCRKFYSVGQHCILVHDLVPEKYRAWGLLHDAAEAYLVDLPKPIKTCPGFGDIYREAEIRLMNAICERFGLDRVEPAEVRIADRVALATEKRDLMLPSSAKWHELAEPSATPIAVMDSDWVKRLFLMLAVGLEGR